MTPLKVLMLARSDLSLMTDRNRDEPEDQSVSSLGYRKAPPTLFEMNCI